MPLDIDSIRAGTPGVEGVIHFNNAGAGLLSGRTLAAMVDHLRLESEIGGYEAEGARRDQIEGTYHSIARLLGGKREEIALFDNSSHAFNAAFYSIPWTSGDRIITARSEYGSNILAYLQIAERFGVEVVIAPSTELGDIDMDVLPSLIDDRTKLIGISHIPTGGGLINPATDIGRIALAAGVPFLLDATQSIGQFPVDVEAIGADFVTGTGRKFLRGPRGIGFLWVRGSTLESLDPFVNDIEASTWDGNRGFTWHPGAQRLETWERSYSNVLGLGSAVDQALEFGVDDIGIRALALGAVLRNGLDGIDGVTTHDLGESLSAIVTAKVDGMSSATFAHQIRKNGVNVSITVADQNQFDTETRPVHPLVRLSPHYYNTAKEIEYALNVIADIANNGLHAASTQ